jgi:hypothetical protein
MAKDFDFASVPLKLKWLANSPAASSRKSRFLTPLAIRERLTTSKTN